jgi:hypothetical protein
VPHVLGNAGGPPPPTPNEAKLQAANRELAAEVIALRNLLAAKDELLVCYRLGTHPSEALLRRLDQSRAAYDTLTLAKELPQ